MPVLPRASVAAQEKAKNRQKQLTHGGCRRYRSPRQLQRQKQGDEAQWAVDETRLPEVSYCASRARRPADSIRKPKQRRAEVASILLRPRRKALGCPWKQQVEATAGCGAPARRRSICQRLLAPTLSPSAGFQRVDGRARAISRDGGAFSRIDEGAVRARDDEI